MDHSITEIISATFEYVEQNDWETFTLDVLDINQNILHAHHILTKDDIITAYQRHIDGVVMRQADLNDNMSPREKIFDLLMDRYEQLNQHRVPLKKIIAAMRCQPCAILASGPQLCTSMRWVLHMTGLEGQDWRSAGYLTALTGIYLYNLSVWYRDDSTDLSATMASLDGALNTIDRFISFC